MLSIKYQVPKINFVLKFTSMKMEKLALKQPFFVMIPIFCIFLTAFL